MDGGLCMVLSICRRHIDLRGSTFKGLPGAPALAGHGPLGLAALLHS